MTTDTLDKVSVTVARFPTSQLREAIMRAMVSVGQQETRYYLNGVFFELGAHDGCLLTSTDGHRLVTTCLAPKARAAGPQRAVIIGTKSAKALTKWLYRIKGDVLATMSNADCVISVSGMPHTQFVCELVNGTYPDWRRVLPGRSDRHFTVSTKNLARALEMIDTMRPKRANVPTITLDTGDGFESLKITGRYTVPVYVDVPRTITRGKNTGKVVIDRVSNENTYTDFAYALDLVTNGTVNHGYGNRVGFNALLLLDLLTRAPKGGNVTFKGDDPCGPWDIELSDGTRRVITPCRV